MLKNTSVFSTTMQRAPALRSGVIERAATIALLAAPLRQELLDTLAALGGEAAVADLAAHMGCPADGLYYHLRLLQRGGLLVALPGRRRDGRPERRYRIAAARGQRLRLAYRPAERANRTAVGRVVDGMLRIARRDFHAGLCRPEVAIEGPGRELWAARGKGWIAAADLIELNALLDRLVALLNRPRRAGRDHLMSLCFVLAPITARARRRPATR